MSNVDSALSAIREHLEQDSFIIQYNDVTHDDLKAINGILGKLTPDERNQVVSRLSTSELNTWTDEIDNGDGLLWTGLTAGLSDGERKDLHQLLAQSLDGQQLARMYSAYDERGQKIELASAVAQSATPSTKVDFIKQLAPETTDRSSPEKNGVITYSHDSGDQDARAVAEVLGSLQGNPLALNNAYAALDDRQLNAVMEGAVQHRTHRTPLPLGVGVSFSYDVKPMTKLIDAAATSDNAELKARVFDFAGRHLSAINDASGISITPTVGAGKQADALAASMGRLYGTDVNGITDALERNYQAGKGMAPFLEHLIDNRGDQGKAQIKDYIAQLARGNDGKSDPFARFTSPVNQDGAVYYPHAEKLGYFAGSLHEAIEGISSDRKEQADLLKDIFGAATGKIPTPGVGDAAGMFGKKGIDMVVNQLKHGDVELFEALVELTIPKDPRTNSVYDGPAENSYNEAWFSVTRQKIN